MAVDRDPSHACAFGDRRLIVVGRRADRLVQLDRGFDDPLPGLVLALGALLEPYTGGTYTNR